MDINYRGFSSSSSHPPPVRKDLEDPLSVFDVRAEFVKPEGGVFQPSCKKKGTRPYTRNTVYLLLDLECSFTFLLFFFYYHSLYLRNDRKHEMCIIRNQRFRAKIVPYGIYIDFPFQACHHCAKSFYYKLQRRRYDVVFYRYLFTGLPSLPFTPRSYIHPLILSNIVVAVQKLRDPRLI